MSSPDHRRNRRRKLLVIADRHELGGAPNDLLRVLSRLDRERFEPMVLLPYESRLASRFEQLGIETWERKIPAWRKVKCWPPIPLFVGEVVRDIYQRGIDLVLALDILEAPGAVLPGWLTARPSVAWFHDPVISPEKMRTYLLHRADVVVAVANHLAEKVRRLDSRTTVTVIHNGVDPQQFNPERFQSTLRPQLSIPSDAFVLAMVGQILERKGQLHLIRALGILKRQGAQPWLLLAGEGKGAYAQEVESAIQEYGLSDRVILLGFHEPVDELLAAVDLFVFLSSVEGLPLALAEAMAMARPCLYSPAPGVDELVGGEDIGLAVPRDQPERIAEVIVRLSKHPDARARKGANARRRIETHFSLDRQVQQFEQLLARL